MVSKPIFWPSSPVARKPILPAVSELLQLKQETGLQEYQQKFEALLSRTYLSESTAIGIFINGLRPEIQGLVTFFAPTTLAKAMRLADFRDRYGPHNKRDHLEDEHGRVKQKEFTILNNEETTRTEEECAELKVNGANSKKNESSQIENLAIIANKNQIDEALAEERKCERIKEESEDVDELDVDGADLKSSQSSLNGDVTAYGNDKTQIDEIEVNEEEKCATDEVIGADQELKEPELLRCCYGVLYFHHRRFLSTQLLLHLRLNHSLHKNVRLSFSVSKTQSQVSSPFTPQTREMRLPRLLSSLGSKFGPITESLMEKLKPQMPHTSVSQTPVFAKATLSSVFPPSLFSIVKSILSHLSFRELAMGPSLSDVAFSVASSWTGLFMIFTPLVDEGIERLKEDDGGFTSGLDEAIARIGWGKTNEEVMSLASFLVPFESSFTYAAATHLLDVIGKNFIKECIEIFFQITENKVDYNKFYKAFSRNLKLGIHEDFPNKSKLIGLLRYHCTKTGDETTSLKNYVTRMKEGQNDIYYIAGEIKKTAENFPFLERPKRGYEVVFMVDAIDGYAVGQHKECSFHGEFIPIGAERKIVLSRRLLNAYPRDWVYDWSFYEDDKALVHPLIKAFQPIANVAVKNQVLYYMTKSSLSFWDDKHGSHVSSTKDFPPFVNSNEWHLDPSNSAGGRLKILQFVVCILSAKECSLQVILPNDEIYETSRFITLVWGGVVVWNPKCCVKDSNTKSMVSNMIFPKDLQQFLFEAGVGRTVHVVSAMGVIWAYMEWDDGPLTTAASLGFDAHWVCLQIVFLLKKVPSLLPVVDQGQFLLELENILGRKIVKCHNLPVTQVLIHWKFSQPEDATWEDLSVLRQQFPNFPTTVHHLLSPSLWARILFRGGEY